MIKKLSLLIVILALFCTSLPSYAKLVYVTTLMPADWGIVYSGTADTNNCSVDLNSTTKRTGDYSINVKCTLSSTSAGDVVLRYALPNNLSEGSYTLTFYAKGTYTNAGIYAGVAENFSVANVLVKFTASNDSDGWKKYTQTINYTGEQYLKFRFVKGSSDVYIDDISFDKEADNAVGNGGFENVIEIKNPIIETETAAENLSKSGITDAYDPYMPQNVMVHKGDSSMTVSWKNPEKAMSSVKLYECIYGEYRLLDGAIDNTSEAYIKYTVENKDNRLYKICFSFEDGKETEYLVSDGINPERKIAKWQLSYNGIKNEQNLEVLPMSVWLDNTEKHGANVAFKISSNATKEKEGNVILSQEINLKQNTDYVLYLWKKEQNVYPFTISYGGNNFSVNGTQPGAGGWECTIYNLKFSEKEDSLFEIKFEKTIDALWLDDIELYEMDSNKMPFGENLVKNGDFEESSAPKIQECVTDFSAQPLELAAKLSWTEADGNVVIYKKDSGKYIKIAEIDSKFGEAVVSNLEADVEQEFVLKVVSSNLNDSIYKTKTVTPTKQKIETGETQITESATNVNVTRSFKNNFAGDGYTVEMIVALFENNVMTKIISSGKTSVQTGENKILTADIDIDGVDKTNADIRIFFWDGLFDLNVLETSEISGL